MTDSPTTRPSLLVRLRDPRDEQAWIEFQEIYAPLIRRLALGRGLQEADAADLTQEVFHAVSRAIERWDPDPARGSFRGWLSRIARNLIVNLLVAQRRHPRGTGDSDVQALIEQQPAPDDEEFSRFEREYRRRLLAWASARIRGEFRPATWDAFWWTGVEGQAPKSVAERLGMTVGAVYIARSRVMARLKREIERFEGEPTNEREERCEEGPTGSLRSISPPTAPGRSSRG
jgi:RNA polymerase sigma-70 factor (ECF subfamily)